jgi:C-terminal processing protease CtpA/Prc
MQRPRTCRLGGRTAGRLSDVMERTLPNGWRVALPYQRCYGEDGKQYQKVGIAPQKLCADDAAWWTAAMEYFKKENQLEGEPNNNVVGACHA